MHNIKEIKENPEKFDKLMSKRGCLDPKSADLLLIQEVAHSEKTEIEELLRKRRENAENVVKAQKNGEDITLLTKIGSDLSKKINELKSNYSTEEKLKSILLSLPNLPDDNAPDGLNENDNVEVRRFGDKKQKTTSHWDIGSSLGMMELNKTVDMSGSRFVSLCGELAILERALECFMLSEHAKFGFLEISPPVLVKNDAMLKAGQLPKFASDSFATNDGFRLTPTSEVTLLNMFADQTFPEDSPRRLTAATNCFRKEAGSAGKDMKGLIRLHQFRKVEMFSVTSPEDSANELDFLTERAENILKKLELPFRTVDLCAGDLGFCSARTYDIEVWMPSQNTYREISSCSNCKSFQARRANIKIKTKDGKKVYAHTLNGSGLAVGRTVAAILENFQTSDNSVIIPSVLRPFMGNIEKISPIPKEKSIFQDN